jgi:hypothetical protein
MVDRDEIVASAGRLRRRLEILQSHQRGVWLGEGLGLFFAVVLFALGVAVALDNLLHLHWAIRTGILAGLVCGAAVIIRAMARLMREPLTAERMAVKVEQKFPQIDNRMINALLLANEDDEDASELIHSVIEEGNADAARVDLRAAIPKRKLAAMLGAAVAVVAMMAAYVAANPNQFMNGLARVLFPFVNVNPLSRTRIVAVTPEDKNILAGNNVTIGVELAGKLPEDAKVEYEPEGEGMRDAPMRQAGPSSKPEGGTPTARFTCLMAAVDRSFTYRVAAGDARSGSYRITVHHRPAVSELKLKVTPPDYTGLAPAAQEGGKVRALTGSSVEILGTCSKPIAEASLKLSTAEAPAPMKVEGNRVSASFGVTARGKYQIELTDTLGFKSDPVERDIEVIADEPPEITLDSPLSAVIVKPEASIPFQFSVSDRYGVQDAAIVQLAKEAEGKETETVLEQWKSPGKTEKVLKVTHQLAVSKLGLSHGQSATLKVIARDWNNVTGPGVARSAPIVVTLMSPEEAEKKSRDAMRLAAIELAQIIQKQKKNIADGEALRTEEIREKGSLAKSAEKLAASVKLQEEIRTASGKLVELMDEKLPMRGVIKVLYESEMVEAVKRLRAVSEAGKPADALKTALDTERTILARLTGRADQLQRQLETAALRDIFAALDELIRQERKIRAETEAADDAGAREGSKTLADRQDKLATQVIQLKELISQEARTVAKSDAEAAKRFDEAAKMVDSRQIRQNMILVSTKLAAGQFSPSVPIEEKIIADLQAIGDFLREPLAAAAAKKLTELRDLLADAKDKTDKLAKLQATVKEISEELERSKDNRGEQAKELAQKAHELEGIKEKIQDVMEQMAKDLALFPEVPSCNELVQEMREVFEDIEQAKGSESTPAEEIAVDRDEGMLAGLDKVKERIADMEMWMMDKPDNIQWKQEAWDKNEMPEIPLVDLPQELEDLVGDLVDKEEEVDEQAQDSSSNASTADIPAGWDVADGPINNWSAKGKSGNEKPNANEMAGRSGSGREGNANGELVEGKAKDLEGRETKARRTNDPFGEGQIEEENPESKAKATGGGKQSGIGGEGGLQGSAPPRNELAMRDLERRQRELRRDAESVYSKASLMYLPTGELDEAIVLMQKAEEQARAGDFSGFSETQRRILHALRNTQRMAGGKGAVEMDARHKLPMDIKEELLNAREEPIPPEFERLVSEYYKAIATGATK